MAPQVHPTCFIRYNDFLSYNLHATRLQNFEKVTDSLQFALHMGKENEQAEGPDPRS